MNPPLINGYLLGKHVEVRLKNGDVERGVVVRLSLAENKRRSITLTQERPGDYVEHIGVWLPPRPREEWVRLHADVESIMVIDRNETLEPELK